MGVKERKAIEKQNRKNQILDAARTLLFSIGLENVSINKIAKQAELGVGTIYFYYKSKEQIFIELQEEGIEVLYSVIIEIFSSNITLEEKLRQIALSYLTFSKEHKNYFELINYFLSSPVVLFEPSLKNQIDMSGNQILTIIQNIVSKGVQQKIFKEKAPQKFSIMFWGTLHGLIQLRKFEKTVFKNKKFEQIYKYSVDKLIYSIK